VKPKIVRSQADADKLKDGDHYLIRPEGFDDPDHDPVEFADAYHKLKADIDMLDEDPKSKRDDA